METQAYRHRRAETAMAEMPEAPTHTMYRSPQSCLLAGVIALLGPREGFGGVHGVQAAAEQAAQATRASHAARARSARSARTARAARGGRKTDEWTERWNAWMDSCDEERSGPKDV